MRLYTSIPDETSQIVPQIIFESLVDNFVYQISSVAETRQLQCQNTGQLYRPSQSVWLCLFYLTGSNEEGIKYK